ncbi:uncharacterized protein LOC128883251 isoform X2 [Hylaeus volcanicus]|uniref:uncharacterized protein LOC128883251 isoform X2 n=1 Tax=Hylaeus volcanicus TaxID=313075 RepID=UPI0023B7A39C|nr:uncharacterized protein LOC128883251 isoform X2 [Hylaeus volcanicus]
MLVSIAILSTSGSVLLYHPFNSKSKREEIEYFGKQIIASSSIGKKSPIVKLNDYLFLYTFQGDVVLVGTTQKNSNAMLILTTLKKLLEVVTLHCQTSHLNEEIIKNNFISLYELFDEALPFGLPQTLNYSVLKKYLDCCNKQFLETLGHRQLRRLTLQTTGPVSWRVEGILHKKNQLCLNIVEYVNIQVSQKGLPQCHININAICDIPNLALLCQETGDSVNVGEAVGRNQLKKIRLTNVCFHQCVNLASFHTKDPTISFIPPDGEFELMSYAVTKNIFIPFQVFFIKYEITSTFFAFHIKLSSTYSKCLFALPVCLYVPCPESSVQAQISVSNYGEAYFNDAERSISWKIRKFPGKCQASLKATVKLLSVINEKNSMRQPVTLNFKVPMFTASGLGIESLQIFEKSYFPVCQKIRYTTQSGVCHYNIHASGEPS